MGHHFHFVALFALQSFFLALHYPMLQRIFVRVVGFSDAERHALNTVFRLSQDKKSHRTHSYEPWLPDAPESPRMLLIDGSDGSAAQELQNMHGNPGIGLIWVGAVSPANAWRNYSRPLRWVEILTSLDAYFAQTVESSPETIDFDLASDTLSAELLAVSSQPIGLHDFSGSLSKRALVADLDREARLYLCSKLAGAGITQVQEAVSVQEAKELLTKQSYQFVSIDTNMQEEDPWTVIAMARRQKSVVLVTSDFVGFGMRVSAKLNGCQLMQKPLHPFELSELLAKL